MVTGEKVEGLLTEGLSFVTDDQHRIAKRVQEFDSRARLAVDTQTGELCIVQWVAREKLGPDPLTAAKVPVQERSGTWLVGIRTGLRGEPDKRILDEMGKQRKMFEKLSARGGGKIKPEHIADILEKAAELQERQGEKAGAEAVGIAAEQYAYAHRRHRVGPTPRVLIPRGVSLGDG